MTNAPPDLENKNIKLAIFFALFGSLCNALMSVFVKLIGQGQSTVSIVFFRFLIGFLILLPWLLTEKKVFVCQHKTKLLLRSFFTLGAMSSVFYALKFLPVSNVMLLNNTFPLFMPLLVLVLLHIKTSMKMWLAVIIGFVGVIFVLHPSLDAMNIPSLIALLSGLLSALVILQIRLISGDASAKQILFYTFLFCTLLIAVLLPFNFKMPTAYEWLMLLLVGFFGAGYQVGITLAVKYALARIVSPLFFTAILFGAVFDWLIWSHIPTLGTVIGMVLIMGGGILTILLRDKQLKN